MQIKRLHVFMCVCVFAGAIGIGTTTVGNTLKHPDFLKNPAMDPRCKASCVATTVAVSVSLSFILTKSYSFTNNGNSMSSDMMRFCLSLPFLFGLMNESK